MSAAPAAKAPKVLTEQERAHAQELLKRARAAMDAIAGYDQASVDRLCRAIGWAGALGAELSALLPVQGLAGLGSYEAGSAAALRWHGIDWPTGIQAALTLHLVVLACSLAFGLLSWWLPRPLWSRHNVT